ncbi:helix-turn-helix transcriptional regulator [Paraburkholderia sp. J94]|uniref:helix-turn-helix transcriptional regulator n=1 Tax=Paraburkholderia sp. J94 TaxID=2805441 RepID=UPI002AB23904|nr:helix-turn-helix domain-containing protein [Paraburkholderia sp. J94]
MLFDLATVEEIAGALAQKLRALRLQQALTQAELAARAGVSERALRNFERSGQATLETFLRVAQALGRAADLEALFELKVRSIRAMEQASETRQRAPRRVSANQPVAKSAAKSASRRSSR